jgi:hypothetical protein
VDWNTENDLDAGTTDPTNAVIDALTVDAIQGHATHFGEDHSETEPAAV